LKIQLHDISAEGIRLALDEGSEPVRTALASLEADVKATPLNVSLHLTLDAGILTVAGDMEGALELSCSRCVDPVHVSVKEAFRFYQRAPMKPDELKGKEDLELSPDMLDYGFLEGDSVDVSVLVQEQLLLSVPVQPLCRDDCQGICQRCGADLNREACRCAESEVDPRFAALKKLKLS